MAKTIAYASGQDKTHVKTVHRLGSVRSLVEAATWRTFVRASVNADGSGVVRVSRDGTVIHEFRFDKE